tara:strand:- start:65 stop:373 length:309 start_codon:yes stop_codon:yes gene_type:complete
MITANGLIKLGFTPDADFLLQDDGDGVVYIQQWLSDLTQPTDEAIATATTQAESEYDAQAYARSRKAKYDLLNQFEMQFDDAANGTTTWIDAINAIKQEFPK